MTMINYRLSSSKDDYQLLALANSIDMCGIIALRTDRNPSFFDLIELRGKSKVYVAVDSKKIVGSICVSHEDVYIKGEIHALSYISDFKVAKSHRNQGIGLQLTNMVTKYLETQNTDFAFLNVSKGIKRPFVFFSDRGNYPDFENIGTFNIFKFIGTKRERKSKKYPIEAIGVTDEILQFLNDYYRQYELANVITRDNLKGSSIFC